ncbi:MAG: FTR1 family protein [archaeon]|nr:FTR1 family protein [archaeon]
MFWGKKVNKHFETRTRLLHLTALLLLTLIFIPGLAFAKEETTETDSSAFLQSLTIILREGVEAILIIGAIVATLFVSNNTDKIKTIYIGAALAIIASLATAFFIDQIFVWGDSQKGFLEGMTLLTAAAVLLFVTNWLLSKAEATKWKSYIKGKVEKAVSQESPIALAAVAFLAVYREGFETVLFYKALFLQTGNTPEILTGILLGSAILLGVFFVAIRIGMRLPVKTFFLSTSVLLFFFAFTFVGSGIHELQEAGTLPETSFAFIPKVKDLGLYPTIETILGQLIVIGFGAFMAYIHVFRHRDFDKQLARQAV